MEIKESFGVPRNVDYGNGNGFGSGDGYGDGCGSG